MTDWTNEEREQVVKVFEWLIRQDKKQNPEKYTNENCLAKSSDNKLSE